MRWTLSLICWFPLQLWANCQNLNLHDQPANLLAGTTIQSIQFKRNDIFDVQQKQSFWFHRFANQYHVVTTEQTLTKDLLFKTGDTLDVALLAETERLLRSRRHLRNAHVYVSRYCPDDRSVEVTVESWDNWSLLPKLGFGHEGGATKLALGIAEDNLFGTGNQIQAEYFSDSERDGYKMKWFAPNIADSFWQTGLQYANSSDGETYQFGVNLPFYQQSSEWAFYLETRKDLKDVNEYALGEVYNEYQSKQQLLEIAAGWKVWQQQQQVQHLTAGIRLDDWTFNPNEQSVLAEPLDRNLSGIWLSWDYIDADYRELTNFNLFNRIEDVNFGWQLKATYGRLNPGLGADDSGHWWELAVEKNYELTSQSWLVVRSRLEQLDRANQPLQRLWQTELKYIRHLGDRHVLINQLQWFDGKDLFRDQMIAVGGDEGMRAFPLNYQVGNQAVLASFEYRYITGYNLYQLIDVALAGFADIGKAWDNPLLPPGPDASTLHGYGFGLRLFPSHSSRGSMISIDLAHPITDNPELQGWNLRLIAKKPF